MAGNEAKLDWMYKGASGLVDREEYLLGRTVDKTLEQLNNEEKEKKLGIVPPKNHVEHECIPPSIRDFNKIVAAEQVDLSAKLQEDPLVAIKKQEEEARRQFLQNPVQLKKLQEALKAQEKQKRSKKNKKSRPDSSDSDLDKKLMVKFKYLKNNSSVLQTIKKQKKKSQDGVLDTILMHKFNELKDKLTEEDMKDILEGRLSETDSEEEANKKHRKKKDRLSDSSTEKGKKKNKKHRKRRDSSTTSEEEQKWKNHNRHKENSEDEKKSKQKHAKAESDASSDSKGNIKKRSRKETGFNRTDRSYEIEGSKSNKRKHSKDRHTSNIKRSSSRDRSRMTKSSDKYKSKEIMRSPYSEKKFVKRKKRKSESSDSDSESESSLKRQKRRSDSVNQKKKNKYKQPNSSSDESSNDGHYRKPKRLSDKEIESRHDKNSPTRERLNKLKHYSSCSTDKEIHVPKEKGSRNNKKSKIKKCSDTSDSSSEDEGYERHNNKQKKKHNSGEERRYETKNSEDNKDQRNVPKNLDQLILEKLRLLRNSNNKQTKHKSSSDSDSKQHEYSHYDSDGDKPIYKEKSFGLLKADGTKIELKRVNTEPIKIIPTPIKMDSLRKPDRKQVKRLTEAEKEQLRQQMIKDAEVREQERSENLRKYREENREEVIRDFDKNFAHKELLKSTKDTSVEERIKSKINNIQRSSAHMNSNFSKRS